MKTEDLQECSNLENIILPHESNTKNVLAGYSIKDGIIVLCPFG